MKCLLVVDIGNTNIVLGLFNDDSLVFERRLTTVIERTSDEYAVLIKNIIDEDFKVDSAVISSVVPPLTGLIEEILKDLYRVSVLVIDPTKNYGTVVNIKEPATLGADRIVNAVAAKELFGAPCIVVDFGTATTFDVIGSSGAYEGGAIAPGLTLSVESLVNKTSKLPRIEIKWPESVIGKTTTHAMQSGALFGYLALVDGMLEQIASELNIKQIEIIATGGNGRLISERSKYIKKYEPHLTLIGMKIIVEKYGRD